MSNLAKILIAPLVGIMSLAGYSVTPQANIDILNERIDYLSQVVSQQEIQMKELGAFTTTGGTTYRLNNSISSTASTINLSSFKEPISNIKYTMTYLGTSVAYGTLDPQNPTKSEFISFTGITQNSDGTAQLTGVTRGLNRTPGTSSCTASTSLATSHSAQTEFILSNTPCFYSEFAVKRNDETISGSWSFGTPTIPANPATKSYVDGLEFGGIGNASETATGTVELATGIETASSTSNGALGRLVIPASLSTSTCTTNDSTCALRVVVTKNDGKIDDNRISTSTLLVGPINIRATATTSLATTTINGGNPEGVIASTSLSTASNSITLSNIPPRDYLKIIVFASTTNSNTDMQVVFNSDSSSSYTFTTGTTTASNQAYWGPFYSYNGIGKFTALSIWEFANYPTAYKLGNARTSLYESNQTIYGGISTSTLIWKNNTTRINSITISATLSGQFMAGSFIKVYGETSNP